MMMMMMMMTIRIIIKYFKIFKVAPTCFGSQGIHRYRALYSVLSNYNKYATITPTTSVPTDTIEPLL